MAIFRIKRKLKISYIYYTRYMMMSRANGTKIFVRSNNLIAFGYKFIIEAGTLAIQYCRAGNLLCRKLVYKLIRIRDFIFLPHDDLCYNGRKDGYTDTFIYYVSE